MQNLLSAAQQAISRMDSDMKAVSVGAAAGAPVGTIVALLLSSKKNRLRAGLAGGIAGGAMGATAAGLAKKQTNVRNMLQSFEDKRREDVRNGRAEDRGALGITLGTIRDLSSKE